MLDQLKLRWPAGWTKLHVYFVPDPIEVRPLVDAYREVLDRVDFLTRQPDEWLHSTMMVVDDVPAREVTAGQRAELAERLRRKMAETPAFTVACGPAVVQRSSVCVKLVPDQGFSEVIDGVKAVAGAMFGHGAVQYSNGRPHITLAYATGDGDSDVLQASLRGVADVRAVLTVNGVHLVDVVVDIDLVQFRWEELAELRLMGVRESL